MAEKSENMPSTSGAGQQEVKEIFDMANYSHILDSDEEDFDDFTEEDRKQNPEYFLTDKEVDKAFKEMSETERKYFLKLKEYHKVDYMQRG